MRKKIAAYLPWIAVFMPCILVVAMGVLSYFFNYSINWTSQSPSFAPQKIIKTWHVGLGYGALSLSHSSIQQNSQQPPANAQKPGLSFLSGRIHSHLPGNGFWADNFVDAQPDYINHMWIVREPWLAILFAVLLPTIPLSIVLFHQRRSRF